MSKFELGSIYQTSTVGNMLEKDPKFQEEVFTAIKRYINADWGDTCIEDKKLNDNAVATGDDRIVAKYETSQGDIFIITEWDRSATTILFTDEY